MDKQIKQDIKKIMLKVYGLDITIEDIENVSTCEGTEYQTIIDNYYYTFYITEEKDNINYAYCVFNSITNKDSELRYITKKIRA